MTAGTLQNQSSTVNTGRAFRLISGSGFEFLNAEVCEREREINKLAYLYKSPQMKNGLLIYSGTFFVLQTHWPAQRHCVTTVTSVFCSLLFCWPACPVSFWIITWKKMAWWLTRLIIDRGVTTSSMDSGCVCQWVSEIQQANIFSVVYAWLGYVHAMAVSLCSAKAVTAFTHRIMYNPSCIHSCERSGHVVSLFGLQIMQQPACKVPVFVAPSWKPFMTSMVNILETQRQSFNKTLKLH